ncbi:hypothetical protein AS038_01185 [Arthrobacter sp. NIO-1057]|nr:hypothetical protein AS038_01185 [Arthrobacter sp. NIO-1057]
MSITGLPGRPTIQGKNERSHRTLQRFLTANKPQDLADVQRLLKRYGEHYNKRRPHQALNQATPQAAWELLEHTPATEPIHLSVLEAKAAEYLSKRRLVQPTARLDVVVSKSGEIMKSTHDESDPVRLLESNQMLVEVTKENRRTFYQGFTFRCPHRLLAASSLGRLRTRNFCCLILIRVRLSCPSLYRWWHSKLREVRFVVFNQGYSDDIDDASVGEES